MKIVCSLSAVLMTALIFAQGGQHANWKLFRSSNGFVVRYPANWFLKGDSNDRLTILSSLGGAEAIIIRRNQAVISVMEETNFAGSNLSQVMDYYTRGAEVLLHTSVHNGNADSNRCSTLQEIVSREPAVPPEDVPGSVPNMVNTEYFCEIAGHVYVTVLRNFEGNTKQTEYQQVALGVARSLRMKP